MGSNIPQHHDDAVRMYLEVLARPEAAVRRAAVPALGEIARRYGQLPREEEARRAVLRANDDPAREVRTAATAVLTQLDALG